MDCSQNLGDVILDDRPIVGRERNNRQAPTRQVLLVGEAPIAHREDAEAVFFRDPQKLTILKITPSHEGGCNDFVRGPRRKHGPQLVREIMVQQNPHGYCRKRCVRANAMSC